MLEISDIQSYPADIPLHGLFRTSQGAKRVAHATIVEVVLANGVRGYGSATPERYVTGETPDSVLESIGMASLRLPGADVSDYRRVWGRIARFLPNAPSARAALEIAVLDAFCRSSRVSMRRFFGGALRTIETDITIPILAPDEAKALAMEAESRGFRALKIKVGMDAGEDLARVQAVAEGAPSCAIRLDGNQGFTPAGALRFISALNDAGIPIELLEQPVDRGDIDGLRQVTERSGVPIFADESVVTPADALNLIRANAVTGMNVKLMKCGLSGALEIVSLCRAAGLDLMIGCMIESRIGVSAAAHLACGVGAFARIDLDAHLLSSDPLKCVGGIVTDGPSLIPDDHASGHGCTPTRRVSIGHRR